MAVEDSNLRRDGENWRATFALRDTVSGLGARSAGGDAWLSVSLSWNITGEGAATVAIADDFATLKAAIEGLAARSRAGDSDALGNAPFRRVAILRPLFAALGIEVADWCCLDADPLPPAALHFN